MRRSGGVGGGTCVLKAGLAEDKPFEAKGGASEVEEAGLAEDEAPEAEGEASKVEDEASEVEDANQVSIPTYSIYQDKVRVPKSMADGKSRGGGSKESMTEELPSVPM
ncbi:hypothetical protein FRC08_005109 [Ceratobasidium sp. 394]|nr:hypothetical protein FRC08_005109 [Ceratobasidium sp. 394]